MSSPLAQQSQSTPINGKTQQKINLMGAVLSIVLNVNSLSVVSLSVWLYRFWLGLNIYIYFEYSIYN